MHWGRSGERVREEVRAKVRSKRVESATVYRPRTNASGATFLGAAGAVGIEIHQEGPTSAGGRFGHFECNRDVSSVAPEDRLIPMPFALMLMNHAASLYRIAVVRLRRFHCRTDEHSAG